MTTTWAMEGDGGALFPCSMCCCPLWWCGCEPTQSQSLDASEWTGLISECKLGLYVVLVVDAFEGGLFIWKAVLPTVGTPSPDKCRGWSEG